MDTLQKNLMEEKTKSYTNSMSNGYIFRHFRVVRELHNAEIKYNSDTDKFSIIFDGRCICSSRSFYYFFKKWQNIMAQNNLSIIDQYHS